MTSHAHRHLLGREHSDTHQSTIFHAPQAHAPIVSSAGQEQIVWGPVNVTDRPLVLTQILPTKDVD